MKNLKLLFLFTVFISASALGGVLCDFPFTNNASKLYTEDLKLLGSINRYDDVINVQGEEPVVPPPVI